MAQFFDKLEHHVEGVMRFLVYLIFICGIVATIFASSEKWSDTD
jgi:hypothetical protein